MNRPQGLKLMRAPTVVVPLLRQPPINLEEPAQTYDWHSYCLGECARGLLEEEPGLSLSVVFARMEALLGAEMVWSHPVLRDPRRRQDGMSVLFEWAREHAAKREGDSIFYGGWTVPQCSFQC